MRHLALFTLLLVGCVSDLDPGSHITRARVLGARVEVDGDPTRAWPAPGEGVAIRWIVASPDADPPFAWALAACVAAADRLGCATDPFAVATGAGEVPEARITVPPAAELGGATALRVLGIICAGGEPDVAHRSCAGGAPGDTVVALTVPLAMAGAGAANHSPALAPDAVRLGDAAWTALPAGEEPPLTGCASAPAAGTAALPFVRVADGEAKIRVSARAADRETFTATAPDGSPVEARESLQLSQFDTAGELDRQFSVIEGDDPTTAPAFEVAWRPVPEDPEDDELHPAPPEGLRVRFTFVLRDGRGGVDDATRVACLVP